MSLSLHVPARWLRPSIPAIVSGLVLGAASAGAGAQLAAPASEPAAAPSPPPPAARADTARALERCEASVTETLRKLRGKDADDVQFQAAQRTVAPADEGDVSVKGAGRYRGARGVGNAFTFSCSYNMRSGLTSGVVLREAGGGATAAGWEPNLSRISPEACESAVAQLLTEKHPRVARIAMEPDTRRLQRGADDHILLLGQGALQRAPGMNAVPFSYTCEVNPRNGQVLGVKTSV